MTKNSSDMATTTGAPSPSPDEIIMPPLVFLVAGLLGLTALWLVTHYCRKSNNGLRSTTIEPSNKSFTSLGWTDRTVIDGMLSLNQKDFEMRFLNEDMVFLSEKDAAILEEFKYFHNRLKDLLQIALPAIMTLVSCPLTIFMHKPVVKIFWPPEKYSTVPPINEAIACFLAPAGMVYAVSFGFAFQQVLSKQLDIIQRVSDEIGQIDQVISLIRKLKWVTTRQRLMVYKSLKTEIMYMMVQFMDKNAMQKFRENATIWQILDHMRDKNNKVTKEDSVDSAICRRVVKHVSNLNNASDNISTLHAKMHILQWLFLETLGYFSFLGVLMIKAESYRLELSMCVLTVLSIAMLCYIVSDLDSPFHGFFRIDLTVVVGLLQKLEKIYYMDLCMESMDTDRESSIFA